MPTMIERTYRVNDVIKSEFLRLPLTLLANPKYKAMSLEAKFIYSLLLNRMTLSQRNDWINEDKVTLAPGEEKTVSVELTRELLGYFNEYAEYIMDESDFDIWMAHDSTCALGCHQVVKF